MVDFEEIVRGSLEEPFCDPDLVKGPLALDLLPSLVFPQKIKYGSELGLKEPLQKLGGETEATSVVGTRIARALRKVGLSLDEYFFVFFSTYL